MSNLANFTQLPVAGFSVNTQHTNIVSTSRRRNGVVCLLGYGKKAVIVNTNNAPQLPHPYFKQSRQTLPNGLIFILIAYGTLTPICFKKYWFRMNKLVSQKKKL